MSIKRYINGYVEVIVQNKYRYIGFNIMRGCEYIPSNIEINLWKFSIYINLRRPK